MNQKMIKKISCKRGFTLAELMIATFVLVLVFTGAILTFINCMNLNEMAKNSSVALSTVKNKITEIENTAYNLVSANYDNATFTSGDLNGIGVSTIDNSDPNLLEVTVTFAWQQKNGRVIGEDKNMNGAVNIGEDINNNGILDSPVTVTTAMFNI